MERPLYTWTLLVAAALLTGAFLTGLAMAPVLWVRHPFWLLVLAPVSQHLWAAAEALPLSTIVAVALPRRFIGSFIGYLLGLRFGAQAVDWIAGRGKGAQRRVTWLRKAFGRVGVLVVVLLPGGLTTALAGALRMRARPLVLGLLAGHTLAMTFHLGIGVLAADWLEAGRLWVAAHLVPMSVGSALLVVGWAVWAVYTRRRDAKAVASADSPPF